MRIHELNWNVDYCEEKDFELKKVCTILFYSFNSEFEQDLPNKKMYELRGSVPFSYDANLVEVVIKFPTTSPIYRLMGNVVGVDQEQPSWMY